MGCCGGVEFDGGGDCGGVQFDGGMGCGGVEFDGAGVDFKGDGGGGGGSDNDDGCDAEAASFDLEESPCIRAEVDGQSLGDSL